MSPVGYERCRSIRQLPFTPDRAFMLLPSQALPSPLLPLLMATSMFLVESLPLVDERSMATECVRVRSMEHVETLDVEMLVGVFAPAPKVAVAPVGVESITSPAASTAASKSRLSSARNAALLLFVGLLTLYSISFSLGFGKLSVFTQVLASLWSRRTFHRMNEYLPRKRGGTGREEDGTGSQVARRRGVRHGHGEMLVGACVAVSSIPLWGTRTVLLFSASEEASVADSLSHGLNIISLFVIVQHRMFSPVATDTTLTTFGQGHQHP